MTKYVELSVEDLRTRVRFQPPKLKNHLHGGFLLRIDEIRYLLSQWDRYRFLPKDPCLEAASKIIKNNRSTALHFSFFLRPRALNQILLMMTKHNQHRIS